MLVTKKELASKEDAKNELLSALNEALVKDNLCVAIFTRGSDKNDPDKTATFLQKVTYQWDHDWFEETIKLFADTMREEHGPPPEVKLQRANITPRPVRLFGEDVVKDAVKDVVDATAVKPTAVKTTAVKPTAVKPTAVKPKESRRERRRRRK